MRREPRRLKLLSALGAATLVAVVWSPVSQATDRPPSEELVAVGSVDTWTAPRVDVQGLLQEDECRRTDGLPLRVGFPIRVDLSPSNAGSWEERVRGAHVWRLKIRSEGALWTALGLDVFRPAPGAILRIYDPTGNSVLGPFTSADAREHGQLWMPPVAGDTLVVELEWPEGLRNVAPELRIGTVSHGYRPWGGIGVLEDSPGNGPAAPAEAGSCNIDVNCPPGADWQDAKRGVVKLFIGGSGVSCSGSLINNTDLDCAPYVLTGDHCFDDPGATPESTTFRFNYERPACEPGTVPEDQWLLTGSTFRASHDPSDFRLLELDQAIPADFEVFFNGWSRSTQPAAESWTIHHPDGDVKKISHDEDPLVDGQSEGPDHWRVNEWEEGTTEDGSSGAPLFDPDRRIVGQLHVATASCANPSGFTEFGKLDVSWGQGLSTWLDPGASGVTVLDGMDQGFCGAPGPRLAHDGHVVVDDQGSQNGKLDPGEIVELQVRLANDGPLGATLVEGTLSTNEPLVSILDNYATWADIAAHASGMSEAPHFSVDVDPEFECGKSIPLELSIMADEGSWPASFLLGTGTVAGTMAPPPFEDDMENGTGDWTAQILVGSSPWSLIAGESNSPTHSWHVPDVTGIRDSVLIMPAIASLPSGATLRFAHLMNSDPGDGGVLELSTNGVDWLDAGDRITQGPYNSVIPVGFSSPIAGRTAWAGDLGGWRTVEADLADLEGEDVTLRWRFASDSFVGGQGWYVDDVVLEAPVHDCIACVETDGDGFCPEPTGEDCNDDDGDVYPGAPQICDGVNNDCDDPVWPSLPANETDADGDGHTYCDGDCNGADSGVGTGAAEICDGFDNDCDGLVDNDPACDGTCEPPELTGSQSPVAGHPAGSEDPRTAWTGSGFGTVWSDARDGNFEIYFSRLDPRGEPIGANRRVTNAAGSSVAPHVVWTGTEHGVAWTDSRAGGPDVYFARLDASGNKIGGDVPIGDAGSDEVWLVWNGYEYALVWVGPSSEIRLARIDASGNEIGSEGTLTQSGGTAGFPALVWTGLEYGLVWHAEDAGGNDQVHFARIDATGSKVGGDVPVTSVPVHARQPAPAWTGSEYGVAWGQGSGGANAKTIYFARLDSSGSTLGGPVAVTSSPTGSRRPSLAWTGDEYGVAWRDFRHGNGEIYFARIDASGTPLGVDLRLSNDPANSVSPAIVWTGRDFGVAWSDSSEIEFVRVGCNCTDADGDGADSCNDNCASVHNPSQADLDDDFQGDHCDIDDGLIYVLFEVAGQVAWQEESGFDAWNLYKGDLGVLTAGGPYTQEPGSNPLAARSCGLGSPVAADPIAPDPGEAAFFLVAGVSGGLEGDLGTDSSGAPRANDHPCP